jgi:hypothetical protein
LYFLDREIKRVRVMVKASGVTLQHCIVSTTATSTALAIAIVAAAMLIRSSSLRARPAYVV